MAQPGVTFIRINGRVIPIHTGNRQGKVKPVSGKEKLKEAVATTSGLAVAGAGAFLMGRGLSLAQKSTNQAAALALTSAGRKAAGSLRAATVLKRHAKILGGKSIAGYRMMGLGLATIGASIPILHYGGTKAFKRQGMKEPKHRNLVSGAITSYLVGRGLYVAAKAKPMAGRRILQTMMGYAKRG